VQNIKGGVNLLTGEKLKTVAVLEIKTLSYWSSQMWTDGIPISYLIQIHVYMIILETNYAEIAILKDGNEFTVEKYQRDDNLCEKIIEISKGFWYNRVVPAQEAFKKKQEAEKIGNISEVEKWDAEIVKYEPEPDTTEAYREFQSERFFKERDSIEGTMRLSKTTALPAGFAMETDEGIVYLKDSDEAPILFQPRRNPRLELVVDTRPAAHRSERNIFLAQMENFVEACRGECKPMVSGAEGVVSLRLLEKLYACRKPMKADWSKTSGKVG
jgi:hypothetical protein